jgi:hypothetical protein
MRLIVKFPEPCSGEHLTRFCRPFEAFRPRLADIRTRRNRQNEQNRHLAGGEDHWDKGLDGFSGVVEDDALEIDAVEGAQIVFG